MGRVWRFVCFGRLYLGGCSGVCLETFGVSWEVDLGYLGGDGLGFWGVRFVCVRFLVWGMFGGLLQRGGGGSGVNLGLF